MTLISSISGTRGTIGGKPGENLTPIDAVKFSAAFAGFIGRQSSKQKPTVVIGRDARPSGSWLSSVVSGTLMASGVNVIDLGLSTTPTVEMAVAGLNADGGIILTASHNPVEWNALKLLNNRGEFISSSEGAMLLEIIEKGDFEFPSVDATGDYQKDETWIDKHIQSVVSHPLVDRKAIGAAGFRIAVDAVNSTGGIAIPRLLTALGVMDVVMINGDVSGRFAHDPEPLPANLTQISGEVVAQNCDMGIVVDPDVDRLALICEDGSMFGEEYTLVAIADYYMKVCPGATVSNLSSSRALRDLTVKAGQQYSASAVGEVNVVLEMKRINAVIGGEGNGGIIVPDLHYGRDALIGIALFLTHLAREDKSLTALKSSYPVYAMAKEKIALKSGMNPDSVIDELKARYANENLNTVDGLKIDFDNEWVHLRKSNTEPIIRIYTESTDESRANALALRIKNEINSLI